MFDIGWSEMAVIMLIALIVIGPKDLPRVARTIGRWVGKGRAMAREFQRAIEDMAKEAELDTVKKEIEKVGSTNFGKTIEKTVDPTGELSKAFDPKADTGKTAATKTAATKTGASKASEALPTPAKASASVTASGNEAVVTTGDATEPTVASPAASPATSPAVVPEAKSSERATVSAEPS